MDETLRAAAHFDLFFVAPQSQIFTDMLTSMLGEQSKNCFQQSVEFFNRLFESVQVATISINPPV